MFSFEITPLGNIFFLLAFIVSASLAFVKNEKRDIFLNLLVFISLGMIFYADNFITLFIGWEIMGWGSYFIISKNSQLKTAQRYIAFNIAGAFALLGAMVIIYGFCGSFTYSEIDFTMIPRGYILWISLLFMAVIFIKSGILPFHYWIADTYTESNHIFSALLSAIISKAGIFLFILVFYEIMPISLNDKLFFYIIAWLGVITSIITTFKAISQDEMKKLLAYSSIAQIGYIITILAVFSQSSLSAALYHTVIHTFTKLLLFINIASIIYISSQKRFENLGGLLYRYPLSFVLLVIGIISLAGMPPLGGFSSKFLIYTELLSQKEGLLLAAVMFSSAASFLYCYKLVYGIYLGQKTAPVENLDNDIPKSFFIPQLISALIIVLLGAAPGTIIPYFNSVSLNPLEFNGIFTLNSSFATFNGGVVMGVFAALFVVILLIITGLKNKKRDVNDRYDISYCGEVPKEGMNLHYGYGMAKELNRIGFIRVILKNSSSTLWNMVQGLFFDSSKLLKQFYSIGVQNGVFVILLFFALTLYYGVF